ncbi:MAG: hypothetical protein EP330_21780 [Deltaproteobacteria bacterium]|nr:MAG: hypothetical protein EP330_21780 [Deltaproteobacteria bacterium]
MTPLALLLALALPSLAQDAPASEPAEPAAGTEEAAPTAEEAPVEATSATSDAPVGESEEEDDDGEEEGDDGEGDDDDDETVEEEVEELDEELEALQARVIALEGLVHSQSEELARQKIKLLPPDLTWDMEGHYRVRAKVFNHMFEDQGDPEGNYTDGRTMEHRLRLRPVVKYKDLASLHVEADLIENSFWGDNASLASTSLFAADPSNTGFNGQEIGPQINRAWMEFTVPVGLIRVGRQASHWGMGLLANDGNGFDETFGENYGGNSFDRVIFATRPLAILAAATGKEDKEIPLFLAVGVDRLVEEPMYEFYGFKCEPGIAEGDEDYDVRCDPDGTGVTTEDHGYTDEERTADDRGPDWWADQNDDVMEMIYVVIYRGEDIDYFGGNGDLTAGAYVIHRIQRETDSNVIIADAYLDAKVHGVHVQFEGVTIQGKTRAIALQGGDPSQEDPLAKKANIWGWVARAGYEQPGWKALMETGYASGDDNVADENFTGRPLHEDHNAGILLYEEVIARVTAETWTDSAKALWSRGSVYNSSYVFPQASVYPLDNWELATGFLVAFPDKPDGVRILCAPDDNVDCAQTPATASTLGWELDLALKHRWHEHLLFSLETAVAHATDRLNLSAANLNPEGNFFTVQSRIAWEF